MASHSHSHDDHGHSHDAKDHGHSHEILDGPGSFLGREMPIVEGRDFKERGFTVGIGGYVSSVDSCSLRILLTQRSQPCRLRQDRPDAEALPCPP